ncbi:sensor histidine kinase [Microbacterium sp.]|uniref:sensor histidine kinase n=1 Tax=Microbacterium sp. TaxID=51671 RepID=UPI003A8E98F6
MMRMLRRLSIRARIIIGSTAVVIVLVLAAGTAVYAQISSIAVSREKAVLHGIAEVYRGIIKEDPAEPFEKPGVDQHVAIIAPDGAVRMDTLPKDLAEHLDELTEPGPTLREFRFGETYYVYVDVVDTPQGSWKVLVTRESDIAAGIVSGVSALLWTLFIASAVLFAAGAWAVATAALRPVEHLRRSAEHLALQRGETGLLPVSGTGDEIDALARTLNGLIEEVRAASAREQQMVADASHELRNPMAVLRAQLELVDGADPDADRELLGQARATLNRLIRLAQAMLELSRIEAGSAPERTSLRVLAEEVTERVDRLRWHLAEPSSELRGEIDLDIALLTPDATASLDAAGIGHVVDNLVDNALRAAAGEPVHVRVALRQEQDGLELLVSDDGPGFDPLITDRAFERFTRSETSDYAGGGLGLAIVARVAQLAGGQATISSAPSRGAEVGIRVPVSRPASDRRSPNTHQR